MSDPTRAPAGCHLHAETGRPAPPDESPLVVPADAREELRPRDPAARGRLLAITQSGASGTLLPLAPGEHAVAPTDVAMPNVIRTPLRVVGCWTASNAHFAFDSSVILPEIADEIPRLAQVRAANPGAPASIFAHADPVGNDAYNKQLSGRRALSVFGLLTRRVDVWEKLFASPLGGDNWQKGLGVMRDHLGPGAPAGRAALFRAYMDAIARDATGAPVTFAATDFLARGADPGGKGDVQGCGEFNPVLMLSAADAARLNRPENRAERDLENDPNRRMLILFFTPGSEVAPDRWPCPRATEGFTACRKRFFADATVRRSNQAARREHPKERTTFACRFYDRLVGDSPCEAVTRPVTVRLYDLAGRPMSTAPFRLLSNGTVVKEGDTDSGGFLRVRDFDAPAGFVIEWGPRPGPGESKTFPFADRIHLKLSTEESVRVTQELANLGYSGEASLANKVRAFKRDYRERFGLPDDGVLDPATRAAIDDAHSSIQVNNLRGRRGS